MRNPLKLLAGVLLIAVITAVTAIIMLVTALDPNTFKSPLTSLIARSTGLDADIQGDMTFSLLPHIELNLNDLRLKNPMLPGTPEILRSEKMILHIRIWPLLFGTYDIKTIELHGLHLSLTRDSNGTCTWVIPSADEADSASDHARQREDHLGTDHLTTDPMTLRHLKDLNVTNATIACQDQLNKQSFTLDGLNLSLHPIGHDRHADLRVTGRYTANTFPHAVHLDLNSTCVLSPDARQILFQQFQAGLTIRDPLIPLASSQATLTGTLVLQPFQKKIIFRAVKVRCMDLDMFTSSTLNWGLPAWEGSLLLNANPRTTTTDMGLGHLLPGGPSTLRSLDLRAHFKAEKGDIHVKNFHALLDGQTLTGQGRVSQFSLPKITFKVAADRLDLTPYLTLPAHTNAAKTDHPKLPEWLKTLRLRGSLTANAITWKNITTGSARAGFRANKGILRIYPVNARILKGRVAGNIRADLTGPRPLITLTTDLRGLRIQELTDETTNSTNILGTVTAFVKSTYTGTPWSPDQSTIKGTVSLHVTNGTLIGVDLSQAGHEGDSNQRSLASSSVHPFSTLSFQGVLQDGILSTQDFILESDTLDLEGAGAYDLATDHIQGELLGTAPYRLPGILSLNGSMHHPATTWEPQGTPIPASPPAKQATHPQDTHLPDPGESRGN